MTTTDSTSGVTTRIRHGEARRQPVDLHEDDPGHSIDPDEFLAPTEEDPEDEDEMP